MRRTRAPSTTRADLQAWAADALTQHRIFHNTFLHGTSAHPSVSTNHAHDLGNQANSITSAPILSYDHTGARVVTTALTPLDRLTSTDSITTDSYR